jgi:hypothetical protein
MRVLLRSLAAALIALSVAGTASAQVAVGVSVSLAPPALPVYRQPVIPGPGYMWTPGYWAYGPVGYYWVPGTWVMPPSVGLLWTPAYWGWSNGVYMFHGGYWGPHVGFYGGINYGFGYGGMGYQGGYWNHGAFAYNSSVNNVGGAQVTNVYNKTVTTVNNTNVSYNGGTGGTTTQPTPTELAAAREHHVAPTQSQVQHQHLASTNPALAASNNGGHPQIAATSRPGQFAKPAGAVTHAGNPSSPTAGHPAASHPQAVTRANVPTHPSAPKAPAPHPPNPPPPHHDQNHPPG